MQMWAKDLKASPNRPVDPNPRCCSARLDGQDSQRSRALSPHPLAAPCSSAPSIRSAAHGGCYELQRRGDIILRVLLVLHFAMLVGGIAYGVRHDESFIQILRQTLFMECLKSVLASCVACVS